MNKRLIAVATCLSGALMLFAGCSAGSGASTGGRMGLNLMRKDSHLKVWLDGEQAKQNKMKKAASGYSRFKVKEPTETGPKLKFEIEEPDKFGRITMVVVNIFQEFEGDYSHQPEFTIIARDANNPQAQMKPDVEYHLGAPGPEFKVLNLTGDEVEGVELKPGLKYQLNLVVKADKSETAQVFFETK